MELNLVVFVFDDVWIVRFTKIRVSEPTGFYYPWEISVNGPGIHYAWKTVNSPTYENANQAVSWVRANVDSEEVRQYQKQFAVVDESEANKIAEKARIERIQRIHTAIERRVLPKTLKLISALAKSGRNQVEITIEDRRIPGLGRSSLAQSLLRSELEKLGYECHKGQFTDDIRVSW